jgi:Uncharacterized conserved protein (DUF2183)
MKMQWIASLAISLWFSHAHASTDVVKTLVVSDVDDTIKVTNVLNKPMKIFNSLFSKKAFSGMAELYQELFQEETAVFYLSGSPKLIEKNIKKFLEKNHFPQVHQMILKKDKQDTFVYKTTAIRNLISRYKPEQIILIGDDTQVDPEVYLTIAKERPDLVKKIYIRVVRNRKLPGGDLIQGFFSPVEIAGDLYLDGRFDSKSMQVVAKGFINQNEDSKLAIRKRYCPEDGRLELDEIRHKMTEQTLITLIEKSQKKIISTCR